MNASQPAPSLEIAGSRQFCSWLTEQELSIGFSTYQTGKLFLIGTKLDGKLSVFERTFERCMGLAASPDSQTLWMSSAYQLWRFENAVPKGEQAGGYDRVYIPQLGYTTGDVDMHDIGLTPEGEPIFVNTLFSCLARPSETHSFRPIWKPPFISRLAAEDRCHLNGLAMRNGVPAFVTAVGMTDVHEGWRGHRRDGGVIIDIATSEIVTTGLSMPHSPRLRPSVVGTEQSDLFVLNSGAGEFGKVDLKSGRFEPICFCPGYARGLAIHGDFAVIGLSNCREDRTFSGLPLDDALRQRNVEARCGLLVVDLRTGDIVHSLSIEGLVRELYDVVVLQNSRMPSALGFKTDEIRRTISIDDREMAAAASPTLATRNE